MKSLAISGGINGVVFKGFSRMMGLVMQLEVALIQKAAQQQRLQLDAKRR